jgi:hypothetical protein
MKRNKVSSGVIRSRSGLGRRFRHPDDDRPAGWMLGGQRNGPSEKGDAGTVGGRALGGT